MFILQVHPELCAMRSLTKTIPDGMHLIRDRLASFFKGIIITFTDRPDELSIGIEVLCKEESDINRGGIIHKIWKDGTIGVTFYYVLPQARPQTCFLIYYPGNVFQIFQSSVKSYNASKRWGFLQFNTSTLFFFLAKDTIASSFPHSRIVEGQLVKHTIKYNWNQRRQRMDIIAGNVLAIKS